MSVLQQQQLDKDSFLYENIKVYNRIFKYLWENRSESKF